jgi:hypothetical protein
MHACEHQTRCFYYLEVVSKPQVVFEDKASIWFKSGAYTQYVSILNRIATQPSDTRWGFETTSIEEECKGEKTWA